jgi:hypothetical protein
VAGLNDTLDAVIGPLKVAARYVEEVSRGAVPARITGKRWRLRRGLGSISGSRAKTRTRAMTCTRSSKEFERF